MDIEIEGLDELGGNPAPSHATLERHRRQLRAVMTRHPTVDLGRERSNGDLPVAEGSRSPQSVDVALGELFAERPPGKGRRQRRARLLAAAAAVAAVVGGAAATVADRDGSQTVTGSAAGPVCGTELPFTIDLRPEYEGPVPGPAPDANTPGSEADTWGRDEPSGDQLVQHWTSRTGTVELRWPANDSWRFTGTPAEDTPSSVEIGSVTGRLDGGVGVVQVDGFEPPCDRIEIAAFDGNNFLFAASRIVNPSCAASRTLTVLPDVGSPVTGFGVYPTATDALDAFSDFLGQQYPELRTSEESGLGRDESATDESEPRDGRAVELAQVEGGWTVTRWAPVILC